MCHLIISDCPQAIFPDEGNPWEKSGRSMSPNCDMPSLFRTTGIQYLLLSENKGSNPVGKGIVCVDEREA
jgi:hypothetical protein